MGGCPDCRGVEHLLSGLRGSCAEGRTAGPGEAVHEEDSESFPWLSFVLTAARPQPLNRGPCEMEPMCPLGGRAGFNVLCALAPSNTVNGEKKQQLLHSDNSISYK